VAEGPVDGWTGCNDYSWTYRSLPGGAISVAGLSQSQRNCDFDDPVLTKLDRTFIAALKAARRIDIVGGRLEISTDLGPLVFEPMAP
jgi:heat shock protein HslJ